MQKLTLDQTWSRCLAMWRWIVKEHQKDEDRSITSLKAEWLRLNDPTASLCELCYFCEYADRHGSRGCDECPGARVDPDFSCTADGCEWDMEPAAFLRKLERLKAKYEATKQRKPRRSK